MLPTTNLKPKSRRIRTFIHAGLLKIVPIIESAFIQMGVRRNQTKIKENKIDLPTLSLWNNRLE